MGSYKNKKNEGDLEILKSSIEILSDLFDTAYYGMTLVDREGRIIKWNYEKLMGIKEKDVLNKHVQEVIENTRLHIVAQTGEKEICHVQKIQGYDMITSRVPIIKNGKVIGAAGTVLFKDIKELKSLAHRLEVLESTVHRYRGEIKKLCGAKYSFDHIITRNNQMNHLKEMAKLAAESNATVLIQGESGTGKEFFAHAIHKASFRKYGPFITINCAAIPKELLESELFGYEGGAFTGAKKEGKIGKFELANGGTILLDEIGTMPLEMQAKLLRVLEAREFERVGGAGRIELDIRIIASTNENLEKAVEEGRFRQDLYYRLNVIPITIPALRYRREDIPLLAESIMEGLAKGLGVPPKRLHEKTMMLLSQHDWPGNVRELRNILERALTIARQDVIYPHHLPEYLYQENRKEKSQKETLNLKEVVMKAEIKAIQRALKASRGNKTLAAKNLGIHRTALYKKMELYGLNY